MANICQNEMFVGSIKNVNNIEYVLEFLCKHFRPYESYYLTDKSINVKFKSKWTFPEELMNQLYDSLPDKSDIFMKCLSVEYGMRYHALWECNENGWIEY